MQAVTKKCEWGSRHAAILAVADAGFAIAFTAFLGLLLGLVVVG